jgi:hypothetical protein
LGTGKKKYPAPFLFSVAAGVGSNVHDSGRAHLEKVYNWFSRSKGKISIFTP